MKQAELIATKLQLVDVDITVDEVAELITDRAEEFSIDIEMATPLIEKELIAKYDLDLNVYENTTATEVPYAYIEDLDSPDEFVQVVAIVDDLWDEYDDRIQQVGTLADDTGRIKFTVWNIADQPLLERGTVYHIWNAVVKEYNGKLELKITAKSDIEQLTGENYDVSEYVGTDHESTPFSGVVTRIEHGSGLVERCSVDDCTRVLKNGHCSEHGNVEGEDDLRIKAIVDNGSEYRRVTMTTEVVETLLGFRLQDALSHPDIDVDEEIHQCLVGQYADCMLVEYEHNNYVSSIELNADPDGHGIIELYDYADELRYIL